ncbi:hypothetical protein CRENBAI_009116 [Crenichthys baileyi]|uniref:Uncharacterized protein n=1 Tax=Crenichthys baileyi TaxID=28760 RepID=A0AAV9SS28_9TELE
MVSNVWVVMSDLELRVPGMASLAGSVILWKKLYLSLSPGSFSEGASSMRWRVDRQARRTEGRMVLCFQEAGFRSGRETDNPASFSKVLSVRSNRVEMEHQSMAEAKVTGKSCKKKSTDSVLKEDTYEAAPASCTL